MDELSVTILYVDSRIPVIIIASAIQYVKRNCCNDAVITRLSTVTVDITVVCHSPLTRGYA